MDRGKRSFRYRGLSNDRADQIVGQDPFRCDDRASTEINRCMLEGSHLLAPGHLVGLSEPSVERRSFLSIRCGSIDRPSSFARTTSLLPRDRRLLPGQKTAAGEVLLGRGLFSRTYFGRQGQLSLAVEGRRVYLFDGTTVTMPDTPENQAAYPQVYNQKPGLGFPIARIGALTSLSCGAIVNLGFCRYAGKGQGEISLLRRLWNLLRPGDFGPLRGFSISFIDILHENHDARQSLK